MMRNCSLQVWTPGRGIRMLRQFKYASNYFMCIGDSINSRHEVFISASVRR